MMPRADQEKYQAWQNSQELGMSCEGFDDFAKPENQMSRTLDLQNQHEIHNQIEVPGANSNFM